MTGAAENSVEKLISEHQPRLRAFIRKQVSNNEDAEDILQDVFYQLIKADQLMNPIEQVSAWLFKVARNLIINKGTKKREVELPSYVDKESGEVMLKEFSDLLFNDSSSAPSPETEYLRSLVWTELEAALSELPAEQREIFELTELEGIPTKDIAQTLGIPLNTILSRKYYAVKHLRKRLTELYQELIYE